MTDRGLFHIDVALLTGERRTYTRFGRARANRTATALKVRYPRARVEVLAVPPEERQPVCDGERRA